MFNTKYIQQTPGNLKQNAACVLSLGCMLPAEISGNCTATSHKDIFLLTAPYSAVMYVCFLNASVISECPRAQGFISIPLVSTDLAQT